MAKDRKVQPVAAPQGEQGHYEVQVAVLQVDVFAQPRAGAEGLHAGGVLALHQFLGRLLPFVGVVARSTQLLKERPRISLPGDS